MKKYCKYEELDSTESDNMEKYGCFFDIIREHFYKCKTLDELNRDKNAMIEAVEIMYKLERWNRENGNK